MESLHNLQSLICRARASRLKIFRRIDSRRANSQAIFLIRTQLPANHVFPEPFEAQSIQASGQYETIPVSLSKCTLCKDFQHIFYSN